MLVIKGAKIPVVEAREKMAEPRYGSGFDGSVAIYSSLALRVQRVKAGCK